MFRNQKLQLVTNRLNEVEKGGSILLILFRSSDSLGGFLGAPHTKIKQITPMTVTMIF